MIPPASEALLLLCAHLAAPGRFEPDPTPLSSQEWRGLAARLNERGFRWPEPVLEEDEEFWSCLRTEASRLRRLVDRREELGAELERLESIGVRVVTRYDPDFPGRLDETLGSHAPPFLYVAGDPSLASARPGLAIVGSRDVDEAGAVYAHRVARACARSRLTVISGGARGVDQIAMRAALTSGGLSVGLVADSLARLLRGSEVRHRVAEGSLVLFSAHHPEEGFTAANAMARNRLIYSLADWALVVACREGGGGTWSGAREALRRGMVPLFVRTGPDAPPGNDCLVRQGGIPFPSVDEMEEIDLTAWLRGHSPPRPAVQPSLFAAADQGPGAERG